MDWGKFETDLRAAISAAQEAAAASDDGGTCNLDSLVVHLPRVKYAKLEAVCKAAGSYASRHTWSGRYFVGVRAGGQANSRTVAVQAAARVMRDAGWDAHVHYAMD